MYTLQIRNKIGSMPEVRPTYSSPDKVISRERVEDVLARNNEGSNAPNEEDVLEVISDTNDDVMQNKAKNEEDVLDVISDTNDDVMQNKAKNEEDVLDVISDTNDDVMQNKAKNEEDVLDVISDTNDVMQNKAKNEEDVLDVISDTNDDVMQNKAKNEEDVLDVISDTNDDVMQKKAKNEDVLDVISDINDDVMQNKAKNEEDVLDVISDTNDDVMQNKAKNEEDVLDVISDTNDDVLQNKAKNEEDVLDVISDTNDDVMQNKAKSEEDVHDVISDTNDDVMQNKAKNEEDVLDVISDTNDDVMQNKAKNEEDVNDVISDTNDDVMQNKAKNEEDVLDVISDTNDDVMQNKAKNEEDVLDVISDTNVDETQNKEKNEEDVLDIISDTNDDVMQDKAHNSEHLHNILNDVDIMQYSPKSASEARSDIILNDIDVMQDSSENASEASRDIIFNDVDVMQDSSKSGSEASNDVDVMQDSSKSASEASSDVILNDVDVMQDSFKSASEASSDVILNDVDVMQDSSKSASEASSGIIFNDVNVMQDSSKSASVASNDVDVMQDSSKSASEASSDVILNDVDVMQDSFKSASEASSDVILNDVDVMQDSSKSASEASSDIIFNDVDVMQDSSKSASEASNDVDVMQDSSKSASEASSDVILNDVDFIQDCSKSASEASSDVILNDVDVMQDSFKSASEASSGIIFNDVDVMQDSSKSASEASSDVILNDVDVMQDSFKSASEASSDVILNDVDVMQDSFKSASEASSDVILNDVDVMQDSSKSASEASSGIIFNDVDVMQDSSKSASEASNDVDVMQDSSKSAFEASSDVILNDVDVMQDSSKSASEASSDVILNDVDVMQDSFKSASEASSDVILNDVDAMQDSFKSASEASSDVILNDVDVMQDSSKSASEASNDVVMQDSSKSASEARSDIILNDVDVMQDSFKSASEARSDVILNDVDVMQDSSKSASEASSDVILNDVDVMQGSSKSASEASSGIILNDVVMQDIHDSSERIHELSDDGEIQFKSFENNVNVYSSNISVANFILLNQELNNMKPYLEVCEELKFSNTENMFEHIPFVSQIPSAPEIIEGEIEELAYQLPTICKPRDLIFKQMCLNFSKEDLLEDKRTDNCFNSVIKPFSENQLLTFYNNPQLENINIVIDSFLESENYTISHKFYEIVLNYFTSQNEFVNINNEIKTLINEFDVHADRLWTFEKRFYTEKSKCKDNQLLSAKYMYEIANFDPNTAKNIATRLKQIKEYLYDRYSLKIYKVDISKLQVENFLNNIIFHCDLKVLPKNGPDQCQFKDHTKDVTENVKNLKECISVLMSFCRRDNPDNVFLNDVKAWLSDAVAILLRVATSQDHLFIVNHLMRCPIGVGDWGSRFIQIVPPSTHKEQDLFKSDYLNHLITVLSIILNPVKKREMFLHHFNSRITHSNPENKRDSVFVVVDESGDDDEECINEMLCHFGENDILQFLNQIPFEEMFKHNLLPETLEESETYEADRLTEMSVLKLIVFFTQLLKIFNQGLRTYYQSRFKSILRRLGRLIQQSVNYVTDNFKGLLQMRQREAKVPNKEDTQISLQVQVEYDEFFENAVKTVFLSPRCGAWRFLAVIPYDCVSIQRLWKIAYKLHTGNYEAESAPEDKIEECQSLLSGTDARKEFHKRLLALKDSKAFCFLTALTNMAIARSEKDRDFIECIVSNLFDAIFLNEKLRKTQNRAGRDLVLAVANKHPFIISTLITDLQVNLCKVGNLALDIVHLLPLSNWHPAEDHLQRLSSWLLNYPVTSLENSLAQVIIKKLNWGFSPSGDSLTLPRIIHERVALLIVEASIRVSSQLRQGNLISEGVKQVTAVVYDPSAEQEFLNWCWSMLNQLHLHQMDQPETQIREVLANQKLVLQGIRNPLVTPSMEPLKKGLIDKDPFSVFAALLMSTWGHSVPEIFKYVPENLELMVSSGHSEEALTVLSLIIPLFFNQHEELVSDTKFLKALQCILASDQTYVNLAKSYISSDSRGKIVSVFRGMILDQLFNFRRYNLESSCPVIKFWIDFLVLVPNWTSNLSVLKLVDVLCQASIMDPQAMQLLKEVFTEQQKVLCTKSDTGFLGGFLALISSSFGNQNSLLEKSFATEVPWFALCVLICEIEKERRSGLWKGLLKYLRNKPYVSLDDALKKVCADIQSYPVCSNSLVLYRLGQQLIDLPSNHIAFPATMQIFLTVYLAQTSPQAGQYDCSSVIYKFYEDSGKKKVVEKIKLSLKDCILYWKNKLMKEKKRDCKKQSENSDLQNSCRIEFLTELISTLKVMRSWMEETQMYEKGLDVSVLPQQSMPEKLLQIFQENLDLWPELMNNESINTELDAYLRFWSSHRQHTYHSDISDSKEFHQSPVALIPFESIGGFGEYDLPKPPPSLPSIIQKDSRLNEKPLDKELVLQDIKKFVDVIMSHSKYMAEKREEMNDLDVGYMDFMAQLWKNQVSKKVLALKCRPGKKSELTECSGPARITVEFKEKLMNEGIKMKVEQNREHHLSIYNYSTQGPPLQVCEAALQLEDLVSNVVSWHKNTQRNGDEASAADKAATASLVTFGRKLFYHFVVLALKGLKSYPPAKELFASCADALGQDFIREHEDCQKSLLLQILQLDPRYRVFLSPHFTPMMTSFDTYLANYAVLGGSVSQHPALCYMLLSKFEMKSWLRERKPSLAERSELIKCVCGSLSSIIALNKESTVVCLGLYRTHLEALLNYNFPEHFTEILFKLLEMSIMSPDCGDVRRNLWFDFLSTLSQGIVKITPKMTSQEVQVALRLYAETQTLLSPAMVKDTIELLSFHFVQQRVSEFGFYGLYSKYKSDVTPVVILLGMMSFTYIMSAPMTSQQTGKLLSREIWLNLEGLWTAWVAPLEQEKKASGPQWIQELILNEKVLFPWTPGDVTGPVMSVGIFASTLAFFNDACVDYSVLSKVLEYYHNTFASSTLTDYILSVVHDQLCALSWSSLEPTLKDLELFSKILNKNLRDCTRFIGNIFIQISWEDFERNFLTEPENCARKMSLYPDLERVFTPRSCHGLLLGTLLRVSMNQNVQESELLLPVLSNATNFRWHLLDEESFEDVLNWFVKSCDAGVVLEIDELPINVAIIRLLYIAGGFSHEVNSTPHEFGSTKRYSLIRNFCLHLTNAVTKYTALLSAKNKFFRKTYTKMMTCIEKQIVNGVSEESKYEEGFFLSSEAVKLIGGGETPLPLQEACRDHLLNWLKASHHSREFLLPLIAAISKGVLHLPHRSPLMEECIAAIFTCSDLLFGREQCYWNDVVKILSFTAMDTKQMLTFAAEENHLLVIYVHTKWRIHVQQAPSTEYSYILSDLMNTLKLISPNERCEEGLLLLLGEIIDLLVTEVKKGETYRSLHRSVRILSDHLTSWGEKQSSSGILGAIGLGRISPLSSRVRLVCKCLATFLKCQLIAPGYFTANNEHKRSADDDVESDSPKKLLYSLFALQKINEFSPYEGGLTYAIEFINESCDFVADPDAFYDGLLAQMYPKFNYIRHLRADAGAAQSREGTSRLEKPSERVLLSSGVVLEFPSSSGEVPTEIRSV